MNAENRGFPEFKGLLEILDLLAREALKGIRVSAEATELSGRKALLAPKVIEESRGLQAQEDRKGQPDRMAYRPRLVLPELRAATG